MAIEGQTSRGERIADYLCRHAAATPDKEALSSATRSLSYAGLLDEVTRCAQALAALGVAKGDRVATLAPPCPDYFIIFLATTALGGIWMGLNPRYARGELLHGLADAQPSILFARHRVGKRDYREDLRLFQGQVQSLREIIPLDEDGRVGPAQACAALTPRAVPGGGAPELERLMRETTPQDPALLVYTSGTTGKPKGALLHHQGIIRQALAQQALRGPGEVRQINAYPINHIAGVVATSAHCLVAGGYMRFLEKFDAGAILKTLEEKRITLWGGVPVMLQSVLDHPGFAAADLSSISQVSYSGGGASKTLLQRIVKEICPRVSAMYALTEAAGAVTAIPPTDDVDLLAETVGKPLADCEFRLADADGRPVARGEVGEIQVRGPFIMQGYWNQPEATKEAITPEGWLRTKDLARERPDGNIVLAGRLSDMYKSGGYNVYPKEIEQALETHPAVNLACVVGVPDATYGEVGHAFVVAAPGQPPDAPALLDYCRERLANYKIPKGLSIERALPMLPSNKPDKRKLASRAAALRAQPPGSSPSTLIQE